MNTEFVVMTGSTGGSKQEKTAVSHINGRNPNRYIHVHVFQPYPDEGTSKTKTSTRSNIKQLSPFSERRQLSFKSRMHVYPSHLIFNSVEWFVIFGTEDKNFLNVRVKFSRVIADTHS
jgi:hypothetical protein